MQQQAICYRGKYSRKCRKKEAGRERRILLEKEIRWGKSSAQITEFSFVLHHHVGLHCVVGRLFFGKKTNERKCPRILGNLSDDFYS